MIEGSGSRRPKIMWIRWIRIRIRNTAKNRCQALRYGLGIRDPDTGANLPPLSSTPVANLPPISATLAKRVEKFATGVVDTGGAPWLANISANFRNIRNGPNGILWGWVETDSWKKTRSKKSRYTVPLNRIRIQGWKKSRDPESTTLTGLP